MPALSAVALFLVTSLGAVFVTGPFVFSSSA